MGQSVCGAFAVWGVRCVGRSMCGAFHVLGVTCVGHLIDGDHILVSGLPCATGCCVAPGE